MTALPAAARSGDELQLEGLREGNDELIRQVMQCAEMAALLEGKSCPLFEPAKAAPAHRSARCSALRMGHGGGGSAPTTELEAATDAWGAGRSLLPW